MKTVAKLYVSAVNTMASPGQADPQTIIHFNAVYSPNPESENYSWSKATPSGTLKLSTRKEHQFKSGKFYRVYIEADETGPGVRTTIERFSDDTLRVRIETPKFDTKPNPVPDVLTSVTEWHGEWMELELYVSNYNAWPTFTDANRFKITLLPCEVTEGP